MTSPSKILFSAPAHFLDTNNLTKNCKFEVDFIEIRTKREFERLPHKNDYIGWVVNPCPEFIIDQDIFRDMPNLRAICTPSTGKSHINVEDAEKSNVTIRGLLDTKFVDTITASSEFTFFLCLAAIRNARLSINSVLNGHWRDKEDELRGREVSELTIGIIGLGRIGSNLKRYFDAMGAEVCFFDTKFGERERQTLRGHEHMETLLAKSDVVITSVTLNPTSIGMCNTQFFETMKDGAIFINTSRGDVVVEADLLAALKKGKISACALDVLSNENEPNFLTKSKIWEFSKKNHNVLITPHMAGLSTDSERKAQTYAFQLLLEHL